MPWSSKAFTFLGTSLPVVSSNVKTSSPALMFFIFFFEPSARVTKLSSVMLNPVTFKFEAFKPFETVTAPTISNAFCGDVVPMPTLPVVLMTRTFSVPDVYIAKSPPFVGEITPTIELAS